MHPDLNQLIRAAEQVTTLLGNDGGDHARQASTRLRDSVVRPLRQAAHAAGPIRESRCAQEGTRL